MTVGQKNNMASITQDINLDLLSLVTDVSSHMLAGWTRYM